MWHIKKLFFIILCYAKILNDVQARNKTSAVIVNQQITSSVQLGIQNLMVYHTYDKRDLLMKDFEDFNEIFFPSGGSTSTPIHSFPDFTFTSYANYSFEYFRNLYRIKSEDYQASFCNSDIIMLSNPGSSKSGSKFYRTKDDKFFMKSVLKNESALFQKLFPGYYLNLYQNPDTLLPKFFGLYRYQCKSNSSDIMFVTMNNLLPSNIKLHEKYDLKGATLNRSAPENELKKKLPTYKDLDFLTRHPSGFTLEPKVHSDIINTLHRDCRVLESFGIYDYSLLIGVHNVNLAQQNNEMKSDSEIVGYSAKNEKGETVVLYLGLIDILQTYTLKKKVKHKIVATILDESTISLQKPDYYASRFLKFIVDHVLKKSPNESSPVLENTSPNQSVDSLSSLNDCKVITSKKDIFLVKRNDLQATEKDKLFEKRQMENDSEIIYKNIKANQILDSIQLGIKHLLKCHDSELDCDLLLPDFERAEEIVFPMYEHLPEFTFESYAPFIFHYFRTLYKIDCNNYVNSLCILPFRVFSNPSVSESIFFFTQDDKFIMKTIDDEQSLVLQTQLPGYFLNVSQNPITLLPKFFALYRYQTKSTKIGLVVMNNLQPSNIDIRENYELKGTSQNNNVPKKGGKKSPSLNNTDFHFRQNHPNGIFLESEAYSSLLNTLKNDIRFLESLNLTNYTLLMGVHYIDDKTEEKGDSLEESYRAINKNGEELLLFVGIINVLQPYKPPKSSFFHYANTNSENQPNNYAANFMNFMTKFVFKIDETSKASWRRKPRT